MQIGKLNLPKTACLAPMAGVADRAFREICIELGACYTVGEMASSKGLFYNDKKTEELLSVHENERPMAVQIFGDDPEIMVQAAIKACNYNPDVIDINMGCPAPKIANNGSGSALMKNPRLAGEIVQKVKNSVKIPVTVKFRKGWDENNVNAVEFAKIIEQSGADAITIHGRTKKQMYIPPVDLDIIAQVKKAVNIPVIGNGDVIDIKSAINMYNETGCDLIMIGRGALGTPWIFNQIKTYFELGEILPEPCLEEKMQIMLKQVRLACKYKGEYIALRESRRHSAWYMKGVRGAADFRKRCGEISTFDDLQRLAEELIKQKDLE